MPKTFYKPPSFMHGGSTDYWVNDKTGQPFFCVVSEAINSGMIDK